MLQVPTTHPPLAHTHSSRRPNQDKDFRQWSWPFPFPCSNEKSSEVLLNCFGKKAQGMARAGGRQAGREGGRRDLQYNPSNKKGHTNHVQAKKASKKRTYRSQGQVMRSHLICGVGGGKKGLRDDLGERVNDSISPQPPKAPRKANDETSKHMGKHKIFLNQA